MLIKKCNLEFYIEKRKVLKKKFFSTRIKITCKALKFLQKLNFALFLQNYLTFQNTITGSELNENV